MAIKPQEFFNHLASQKVEFFTGVPDSLLKDFCLCIDENVSSHNHVITANEGNAVALGTGYYLSSKKLPLVYMQNSGLGNAINPLLSLCHQEVYSVPMLLVIGWRGEPESKDEPQHLKQGKIQNELLSVMDIPYQVMSSETDDIESMIYKCCKKAIDESKPVAIVIKKNTFDTYKVDKIPNNKILASREVYLDFILQNIPDDSVVISTTGKTSREIFEIRYRTSGLHNKDFLNVGAMGHCSSIALGIAISKPNKKVFCIDGDGALIMHMGNLSTVGYQGPPNFNHILFNNSAHESVGGQETSANTINFQLLAKSNNYKNFSKISDYKQLKPQFFDFYNKPGPNFLELTIKQGAREDLGRPTIDFKESKKAFMNFLDE